MSRNSVRRSHEAFDITSVHDYVKWVSDTTIARAEGQILGCERCSPSSDILFGEMLRSMVGNPAADHFRLERNARCPACRSTRTPVP